jgi:hypothetical protein
MLSRRKTRFIEGSAKCRHIKNWFVKGLCGGCLSVWGPLPSYDQIPPLHTYVYTVYLFTQGKGELGRVEPEIRLERQHFTVGSKIPTYIPWNLKVHWTMNILCCLLQFLTLSLFRPKMILINTCRKFPLQVNFLDDDILLWFLYIVN